MDVYVVHVMDVCVDVVACRAVYGWSVAVAAVAPLPPRIYFKCCVELTRAGVLLEDTYTALSTIETRIQEARLEPRVCSIFMSPFGAYAWDRLELHVTTLEGEVYHINMR